MTLDEVLLYVILGCIVAAVVGIGVGYLLRKRIAEARIGSAEEKAKQIADDAKKMLESASREAETLKTRLKLYIASRKRNWKKYPSYHVHRQRI